jgi:DNA-binding ferritin-like protein
LINRKKLKGKIFLNLIGNASVVFPFATGATLAFATWVLNLEPAILFLFVSGVLGVLGPIAGFITKWATGLDKISRQALKELQDEAYNQQERQLDALHKQLSEDGDARTERMLTDLRTLNQSFKAEVSETTWSSSIPTNVAFELVYRVEALFHESVNCLRDTLKLGEKARETATKTGRKSLLQHRELVIEDVQETIAQLSRIYAQMLTLGTHSDETELSRLRNELDENLAFAKNVEQTMRELESSNIHESSEYDQYVENNSN